MVSDTARAAQMGGFFTLKFRTYGSVFNRNSGKWVAFSEFLSHLKKFEWTLHLQIDKIHMYETKKWV